MSKSRKSLGKRKPLTAPLFLKLMFTFFFQTSSWPSSPPCRQPDLFEQDGWQLQRKTLKWLEQPASPRSSKRSVMVSSLIKVTVTPPHPFFLAFFKKSYHLSSLETTKTKNKWQFRIRKLGGMFCSSFCQSIEFQDWL